MKFKIAVIGLLTAIFATCVFTSYSLTTEAKKQTELQIAQIEGIITIMELSDNAYWSKDKKDDEWNVGFQIIGNVWEDNTKQGIYEPTETYQKLKNILETMQ